MTLLLTRMETKFSVPPPQDQWQADTQEFGEWSMVLQEAARKEVMVWLQLDDTNDSVKERQKGITGRFVRPVVEIV